VFLMKLSIFLNVVLTGVWGYAQSTTSEELVQSKVDILRQQGSLFSVHIVSGEPLKIFVVGREEAKLDLTNMKLLVRRLQPYPEKTLTIKKSGDHYTISEPLQENAELEVVPKVKGQSETFKFKIKAQKP